MIEMSIRDGDGFHSLTMGGRVEKARIRTILRKIICNLLSGVLLACYGCVAHATEYLGLQLGQDTYKQVASQLRNSGATIVDKFGYKGYGDLPMIRVDSYDRFNKYGKVQEAWLSFAPNTILWEIEVTWFDAGETFKTFKDALDSKYGTAKVTEEIGFKRHYAYRDKDTEIVLMRNEFGFGADRTTRLTYRHTPFNRFVDAARSRIEQDIKRKNASKAASDL